MYMVKWTKEDAKVNYATALRGYKQAIGWVNNEVKSIKKWMSLMDEYKEKMDEWGSKPGYEIWAKNFFAEQWLDMRDWTDRDLTNCIKYAGWVKDWKKEMLYWADMYSKLQ